MNVQEVIGKNTFGYSIVIYALNEGKINFEAELISTEIVLVRANSQDEVKEFFGEVLSQVTEVN